MLFSKKWLKNHPHFLLHFLVHIDVLMLLYSICIRKCNKNGEFSTSRFLMKFGQRPCTIIQGLWLDFGATLKIHKKNPILIGISSNFLHNISTCICIRKCNKNGEFSTSRF